MTNLTPERRAELRADAARLRLFRFVTANAPDGYPSGGYEPIDDDITALLDAADERERLRDAMRLSQPGDSDWGRSVDAYHAAGWCGEPGDYERMFFESGWRAAIRTLDGTDGPQ